MRPVIGLSLAVGVLFATACQSLPVSNPLQSAAAPAAHQIKVGDAAPDFTLADQNRENVSLTDYRGRTVQLAFYVWAFSSG